MLPAQLCVSHFLQLHLRSMHMLSLKERIELLENDLKASPPAFTMTADLPFAIFRYDPDPRNEDEGEWRMRKEIVHLATRVHNATNKDIHIVSRTVFLA